jgi:hypothetical protein
MKCLGIRAIYWDFELLPDTWNNGMVEYWNVEDSAFIEAVSERDLLV